MRNVSSLSQTTTRRPGVDRRTVNERDLSFAELMDQKAKGLCFICEKDIHPYTGEVIALEVEEGQGEQLMECKLVGLCGISEEATGKVGPRTTKMTGMVARIPLVVLVDTGASHNFISRKVVSVLGLKVDGNHVMGVKLGDGHRIQTQGRSPYIKMRLGEVKINVEAFIMELGGIDIILGVVWLETLGKVMMDWREMSMSFMEKGREIKLCSSSMGQKSGDAVVESDSLHSIIGGAPLWYDNNTSSLL